MDLPKFQIIYNRATPKSIEDQVDNFWNALLNLYFPQSEYILTQNARPSNANKTKADFIIQSVMGANGTRHVILVEDKHASRKG
jgi:hypothetical protein